MSSIDGTKRRHEEVSGGFDPPPPRHVMRAELKPQPPPNQKFADAQPCVLDLPPGVIAAVGTFLSTRKIGVGHVTSILRKYGLTGDLMALCVVFGPRVARTVRKVYLEYNMDYLEEIHLLANAVKHEVKSENRSDDDKRTFGIKPIFEGNPKALQKCLVKIRARLEAWMSENEWWKDAAKLDPAYHEDNAVEAGRPAIFKTVMLKNIAEEERKEFVENAVTMSPIFTSGHVDLQYYTGDGDVDMPFYTLSFARFPSDSDNNFSAVASVNGTPHTSFLQVQDLLLEEGPDKCLKVVHKVFAEIFFNAALIIDLGLLELLKFQIEELKIDVNYQECAGILFRYTDFQGEPLEGKSLLFHALAQPDQRLFDYLLSLQTIEVNPVLDQSMEGYDHLGWDFTFLHEIPRCANYPLFDEEIDLISRIRRILERDEVDVDCRDNSGDTPLEQLCDIWVELVWRPRLHFARGSRRPSCLSLVINSSESRMYVGTSLATGCK